MQPLKRALPRALKQAIKRGLWPLRMLTAPLRLPPDFAIIGAQKAGTTSLHNYLLAHPYVISAVNKKEISFLDLHYGRGAAWYKAHFPLVTSRALHRLRGGDLVCGDATPNYLLYPTAPERLHAIAPQAKIIALLRDPVERAYSGYQHEARKGREPLSFEDAIAAEPARLAGELDRLRADPAYHSQALRTQSYLLRGHYAEQLERWFAYYPRERCLVLNSAEFFADPRTVLLQVVEFLGLPRDAGVAWEPREYKRFLHVAYGEMSPAVRAWLRGYYAPHNQRLYDLLGVDFGW